jgi:hypothetical protein
MKIKSLGISLAVVTALSFSGCGSSSSDSTPVIQTDDELSKDVVVERGATYDANVTDANGQVAIQKNGENVYTFETTPKAPIKVEGGWIDVDGDGELTTEDIELKMTMTSYSNTVTPVTTYIADSNKTARENKLKALATLANTSEEELTKVASKADTKAILAINAIYQEMKEQNSTNISTNNVATNISALENVDLTGITDPKEIAKKIEAKVMTNLGSKISKMTYDKIDGLQKMRIFGEVWKNRKKDLRYAGNKVYIEDGKLILNTKYQAGKNPDLEVDAGKDGIDSRAELRAKLKTPITDYNVRFKVQKTPAYTGKAQVNAYMSDGNTGYLLTGITVKKTGVYIWAEHEVSSYPNYVANSLDGDINTTIAKLNTGNFFGDEFNASITIEDNKFKYNVTNITRGETYPTKELDMTNNWANSSKKFDQLVFRTKIDNRKYTHTGDVNSTILELIDLETK